MWLAGRSFGDRVNENDARRDLVGSKTLKGISPEHLFTDRDPGAENDGRGYIFA
jgi:hypothetical protein